MLELAHELLARLRAGERVAAVSVTRVARSAPRGVGATMAVTASGEVIGSISGGCVEGDSVMLALHALATDSGHTASFGFTDGEAHAAGLACGGSVDVIAYPVRADDDATMRALEDASADRRVRIDVVLAGPHAGRIAPSAGTAAPTLTLSHEPRARLIILGAGEHAAALSRVAAVAGYAVTVCDAWPLLVTPERFPQADELVAGLPHDYLAALHSDAIDHRTAICVLTHDERLDVPALRAALELPVGFVGAMGARSTVARRAALLRQSGLTDAQIARLHSPLGLDLGGSSPEETAISVIAEIIAARNGGSGAPLHTLRGPVHAWAAAMSAGEATALPEQEPEPTASGSCSVAEGVLR